MPTMPAVPTETEFEARYESIGSGVCRDAEDARPPYCNPLEEHYKTIYDCASLCTAYVGCQAFFYEENWGCRVYFDTFENAQAMQVLTWASNDCHNDNGHIVTKGEGLGSAGRCYIPKSPTVEVPIIPIVPTGVCDRCVSAFADLKGCECWMDDECNEEELIPEGCDACGAQAAEFCGIDESTSGYESIGFGVCRDSEGARPPYCNPLEEHYKTIDDCASLCISHVGCQAFYYEDGWGCRVYFDTLVNARAMRALTWASNDCYYDDGHVVTKSEGQGSAGQCYVPNIPTADPTEPSFQRLGDGFCRTFTGEVVEHFYLPNLTKQGCQAQCESRADCIGFSRDVKLTGACYIHGPYGSEATGTKIGSSDGSLEHDCYKRV